LTAISTRMTANGGKVALLVMHSFTAQMNGFKRPWDVGVLWNDDARLPEPLSRRAAARFARSWSR